MLWLTAPGTAEPDVVWHPYPEATKSRPVAASLCYLREKNVLTRVEVQEEEVRYWYWEELFEEGGSLISRLGFFSETRS